MTCQMCVLGISWPVDYERFLSWFSIFTLNFPELVPLQCITPYDFHDKLRWVIGLMSTFNAAAAFLNFIVSKQHGERMEGIKNRLVYLWVMMNYTTYVSFSTAILRTMPCENFQENGVDVSRLIADVTIDCDSTSHKWHVGLASLATVGFVFGVPLTFVFVLFRERQREVKMVADRKLSTPSSSGKSSPLAFLTGSYRSECWFVEPLVCLQKMSIGGLLVFFEPSIAQVVMGILFAVSWALIFCRLWQFTSPLLNLINDACSLSIILTLLGALSLRATQNAQGLMGVSKSVVSGLLIFSTAFPVAILFVVFIITVGEQVLEKRQRRSEAFKQAPDKAYEASDPDHDAAQQQPPTNQDEAPQSNAPQGQQEYLQYIQAPVIPVVLQRPTEAPQSLEPQGQQDSLQAPVIPVVLQRPAWFEGEQDGRRFYFHEPSGTSQWNPPDEPYVPFTPTTVAAPSAHQAPRIPNGEINVVMSQQQTTLREQPGDVRNL